MQTIIVAVDFTERSRMALNYALQLYHNGDFRFILLHAYSIPTSSEFLVSIDDIIEKDIRKKLMVEGEWLKSKTQNESIELIYRCEKSDIISTINSAIEEYKADIVVIGSDGENSWSDTRYKSEGLTSKIVKEIPLPVLIVPISDHIQDPKKILFAVVLEGIHGSSELKPLVEIANSFHSHLDVINVGIDRYQTNGINDELKKTVNGYFKDMDYELHVLRQNEVYEAIDKFSEEHQNDLLCIMYRKHNLLDKLLRQSVAKKVISEIKRPILTLKHNV